MVDLRDDEPFVVSGVPFTTSAFNSSLLLGVSSISTSQDGSIAVFNRRNWNPPTVYREGEGFALGDSVDTCTFFGVEDDLACTYRVADTVEFDVGKFRVEWARTGIARYSSDGALLEVLASDSARVSGANKYRTTTFSEPVTTPDRTRLAVWSQSQTRRLILDAEGEVSEEIRYAADPPAALVRHADLTRRVDVPITPGPFQDLMPLALGVDGVHVAAEFDGIVSVFDVATGERRMQVPGRLPALGAGWLAVLSETNETAATLIPLDASGARREVAFPIPVEAIAFAAESNRVFAAGFEDVYYLDPRAGPAEATTFGEVGPELVPDGSDATAHGRFSFLMPSPEGIRLVADYHLTHPDPCD